MTAEARLARATTFTFCAGMRVEVRLERRSEEPAPWAIVRGSSVWTRGRAWEHEPSPSRRDDDYLKRARWTFEEAWTECERMEREASS